MAVVVIAVLVGFAKFVYARTNTTRYSIYSRLLPWYEQNKKKGK